MTRRKHAQSTTSRRSFLRHLAHAMPVIVGVTALTWVADRLHLLDSFHFFAMDVFVASAAPPQSDTAVIVDISDDDYREMFNARSPLDPTKLAQIIDDVAKSNPAVIAVDVSTSDSSDADLLKRFRAAPVPIVWARDAFP